MFKYLVIFALPLQLFSQTYTTSEIDSYKKQSRRINIIRDQWGIPHIYGKTDADAVFGLLYAQCEDDFPRVEMNYIEKLGRVSEIKGESFIYNDLQIRMMFDSSEAIRDYNNSPAWLHKLLDAYADGINYFLYKHPDVHPLLLNKFKPWYALMWTDGSIGAIDVGDVTISEIKSFYSGEKTDMTFAEANTSEKNTTGSNGFAIGPSKTLSGNAILYINPHVTFYFRPEVHFVSEEGLNAYGAVTWGQIFIYQGFNEHCGWMHTSSYADVADLYAEKIERKNNKLFYLYDNKLRPVIEKSIAINYISEGKILKKSFKTYFTHHGAVMAKREGRWISVKANNRSVKGFTQSWLRNKAAGFKDYKSTMEMLSNTSNNTVFADDKGNIAYWHGNFIPRRDTNFNWAKPVDGTISATEWKGLHPLDEIIHVYNPKAGFIQNCNSTPFTVSGSSSPIRKNYPSYMAPDGENFRGINASKIIQSHDGYTINKIIEDGYNTHLAAFDVLLPALFRSYEHKLNDPQLKVLEPLIKQLQCWDRNSGEHSIATTIAISWAEKLQPTIMKKLQEDDEMDQVIKTEKFVNQATDDILLQPLLIVKNELTIRYGTWNTEWGTVNRYQRSTSGMNDTFNDNEPSLPVGFAASTWGCLPSFVSKTFGETKNRYGFNGNSFVCVVEFGKKLKARSLLTGGESGNKQSKHFSDQALMYTKGEFKDVNFYNEDVVKNAERNYHPGE